MSIAIQAEGLRKRYGDHHALRGVDLSVPTGTVLGLLGPNGAGKTTAVRVLATLVEPDAGRAVVAGHDVATDRREVRKRIGLTGQYAAVDERLTGRENLRLIGRLHHRGKRAAAARADELLARFDLTDAADRPVKTYSGGMRRRVDLAASLVDEPEVLFLDEPTTGLDPASRVVLWDVISQQVRAGTTVLLTTQYLEEADRLADRIAVLDGGKIVAEGSQAELKRAVGGERLHVRLAEAADAPRALAALAGVAEDEPRVDHQEGRIWLTLPGGIDGLALATTALRRERIEVSEFGTQRPSLDDVFLALIGRDEPAVPVSEGVPA